MSTISGQIYVVSDHIDTDQIIPAHYLNLVPTIPEEYNQLGSYALSGLPDAYPPFVPQGHRNTPYKIIIAGTNFGCGSSREHAPVSLGAAGVQAVIAESFARIFFRNCISTGEVYPIETPSRLCDVLSTGMSAEVDLYNHQLKVSEANKELPLHPLGDVKEVVDHGGLFQYAREMNMIPPRREK